MSPSFETLPAPPALEAPTVRRVRQFVAQGESCCQRDCLRRFWESFQDAVQQFGEDVAACSHDAKEAALLMNLREHLYVGPPRRSSGERRRPCVAYSIAPFGRMCRHAYVLLWDIGVSALHALLTHLTTHANGFCPRPHGLTGTSSNHALPATLQQRVIDFIVEIGEQLGEEDEGRQGRRALHQVEGHIVRFLPASYTVAGLYRLSVQQDC